MTRRARSLDTAMSFVDSTGVAVVLPINNLVLPSLWEAMNGPVEVTVFTEDERGRRIFTAEIERVWAMKNRIAQEHRACVGKHVRGRLTLVSLEMLPSLYALTGREGYPEDFRDPGKFSRLELQLANVLLDHGPRTAPELRHMLGIGDAKATKRALVSLERAMVVTDAGEQEQDHGWDAAVYDILARRYQPHLRRLPSLEDARTGLTKKMLTAVGAVSAADVAAVLGGYRAEAKAVLARLGDEGYARCTQDHGATVWAMAASRGTHA